MLIIKSMYLMNLYFWTYLLFSGSLAPIKYLNLFYFQCESSRGKDTLCCLQLLGDRHRRQPLGGVTDERARDNARTNRVSYDFNRTLHDDNRTMRSRYRTLMTRTESCTTKTKPYTTRNESYATVTEPCTEITEPYTTSS